MKVYFNTNFWWKSAENKKFILILVGAILQLLPLLYFVLTEGQRLIYQPFVFFPHIFISLILSIGAAVTNALINRRRIKEKYFYAPITALGGVLLMLYAIYEILATGSEDVNLLVPIFLFMLLIMIYELIQGILHAVAGHIFS